MPSGDHGSEYGRERRVDPCECQPRVEPPVMTGLLSRVKTGPKRKQALSSCSLLHEGWGDSGSLPTWYSSAKPQLLSFSFSLTYSGNWSAGTSLWKLQGGRQGLSCGSPGPLDCTVLSDFLFLSRLQSGNLRGQTDDHTVGRGLALLRLTQVQSQHPIVSPSSLPPEASLSAETDRGVA